MSTPWIHVEYAAGNYGNSLVFGNFLRSSNYEVLQKTVNLLYSECGPCGIFFVNDLIEEWAQLAAQSLQKYLIDRKWTEIEVRVLAGDVTQIRLPYSHTAHLKNPRIGLILLDGHAPFFRRLADHSSTGLEITTHYPKILITQSQAGAWPLEPVGPGDRYRFPSGRRRRLPTVRFLLRPRKKVTEVQITPEENRLIGRKVSDYTFPIPTWKRTLHDLWHAFLVTLGIRRQ